MNKQIWLYLDDVRSPIDDKWHIVRSYEEFVSHINLHGLERYEVISLDHDLGESAMQEYYTNVKPNYFLDYNNINEKTGLDCIKWLVNQAISKKITLPKIYVHSANPIGASNMMGYLNNYYRNIEVPETCVKVEIAHTYTQFLSKEERHQKYKRN
jgi:hypothetical protein